MKYLKKILLIVIILINTLTLSACWNYKEIADLNIITGMSIDIDKTTGTYLITLEIFQPIQGEATQASSKIIESEGDSLFDGLRNSIQLSGSKNYWGTLQVLILSKDINKEYLRSIIDDINRNHELREDMIILVSKDETASKIIYKAHKINEAEISADIVEAFKNQEHVSLYPVTTVYKFTQDLFAEGTSPIVPTIEIVIQEGISMFKVTGSVAFKGDEQVGFLNDDETKWVLAVKDELKGGTIVVENLVNGNKCKSTLKILKSKTKVKPVYKNNDLTMNINVELDAVIIELSGKEDFTKKENRLLLQADAEKLIQQRIISVIEKVQTDFESDIFGFSGIIARESPDKWEKYIKANWDDVFKSLNTNVEVKVTIKNSGLITKPIEIK